MELSEKSYPMEKYSLRVIYLIFFSAHGFPSGSAGKGSACNAGDLGSIPGLRRSPGEGKGYPLQYSGDNATVGVVAVLVEIVTLKLRGRRQYDIGKAAG